LSPPAEVDVFSLGALYCGTKISSYPVNLQRKQVLLEPGESWVLL
jgi:hypothetical protein